MNTSSSLDASFSTSSIKSQHVKFVDQSDRIEEVGPNFSTFSIELSHPVKKAAKESETSCFKGQFMALIKKSFALQLKQKGTNICQILTPIICLLFLWLMKTILVTPYTQRFSFQLPLPILFNMPYKFLYEQMDPKTAGLVSPINVSDCLQWYLYDFEGASQATKDFVGSNETGLLSNLFPPFSGSESFYECGENNETMPQFRRTEPENTTINEEIYRNLRYVNNLPLIGSEVATAEISNLSLIPDGAVTFYEVSKDKLSFKLQINDLWYYLLHRYNGITRYKIVITPEEGWASIMTVAEGQLNLFDLIARSYAHTLFKKKHIYMISGIQPMPIMNIQDMVMSKFLNVIGGTLYPIALALLMPVFLYSFVLEKEERLREIMKMSGLKTYNYWAANYVWSFTLYSVSAFVFFFVGKYLVHIDFFTDTSPLVLFVTFFGWGLSQISLAFFYQNFLGRSKAAIIFGYLVTLWTSLIGSTLGMSLYAYPQQAPVALLLYPQIALTRIIYRLCLRCGGFQCVAGLAYLDDEMVVCLKVLYLGAIIFFILGLYLDQVLPKEYGVSKHPLFFLDFLFARKFKKQELSVTDASLDDSRETEAGDNSKVEVEDEEVRREIESVEELRPPFDHTPLVIKHLRKVYKPIGGKPAKIAVKDFSLHIKKGEAFGLLGPNGAGKTSLISMLTGLYPPESGNAWVGGYDIINNIEEVHTQIGVCPQFDLLWPDLTVEEHLYFYARIRRTPNMDIKAVVMKAMEEVHLTRFASFPTKTLSGGMKRRLSVAIALVGNPKVIYLDEPTTGLDPENRRQLWDILSKAKQNRAVILTTHSMEEADVLCSRIGIMTNGAIQCIGTQTRLKGRYGGGYHLFVNCHRNKTNKKKDQQVDQGISQQPSDEENHQRVQEYIKSLLPHSELKSAFNGNFVFLVPTKNLQVSQIFVHLESKKEDLGICDWGISQSTLEDVFMEVV